MNSQSIICWMIAVCVMAAVFILFSKPMRILSRLCINGIMGVSALFIGNYFLAPLGLSVGINLFTALFTAFLGIPGALCLYFFRMIL